MCSTELIKQIRELYQLCRNFGKVSNSSRTPVCSVKYMAKNKY